LELREGQHLRLTSQPIPGTNELISIPDVPLSGGALPGDLILIDEGKIRLRVVGTITDEIVTEVEQGGTLGERKAVNFSSGRVSLPVLTPKDMIDLKFGLAHQVDFVALSFIRQSKDLLQVRDFIRAQGRTVPLVAKLERREAIDDLRAILGASDACMVARGDLGVEMSPEEVPTLQKRIIRAANATGKPVITATQMLESMIEQPYPTRAEASDVANAVWDGTDAVMLSAETAIGRHPVAAVRTMARIITEAEEELLGLERRAMPASVSYPQAVTQTARDPLRRSKQRQSLPSPLQGAPPPCFRKPAQKCRSSPSHPTSRSVVSWLSYGASRQCSILWQRTPKSLLPASNAISFSEASFPLAIVWWWWAHYPFQPRRISSQCTLYRTKA
jgi:pyruvate kinase